MQLQFEDVVPGMEIPALVKHPSTRDLVKWAGGSGDFCELHYDQTFARNAGLPDVIVHGRLKAAYLTQMMTDWIGERGDVCKFSVRYRETDFPAQELTCRGTVTARYEQGNEHYVECEVWTENPQGQRTTTGSFTVRLPSRH